MPIFSSWDRQMKLGEIMMSRNWIENVGKKQISLSGAEAGIQISLTRV